MLPAVSATATEIIARLGLVPHPEGGFFRETYRAALQVATPRGTRAAATAILFLVTAASPSRFHRLASDELWLWQGGAPLELVTLAGAGPVRRLLGPPDVPGTLPQALVTAGDWQAARLAPGEASCRGAQGSPDWPDWALVACLVAPGFDPADFELAERGALLARFPGQAGLVRALT